MSVDKAKAQLNNLALTIGKRVEHWVSCSCSMEKLAASGGTIAQESSIKSPS